MTPQSFDVVCIGRVGVDLYPMESGVGLEDVRTFGKFLGGSATNVAVAAARYGHTSAIITRTGDDPFGRFVKRTLDELGVDTSFVGTDPWLPTPVTFCELFPPDHFPLYFYRYPQAPDLRIAPEQIPPVAVADSRVFWTTLTGLSAEPSRTAHARRPGSCAAAPPGTVLDLDYRPMFWLHESDATRAATPRWRFPRWPSATSRSAGSPSGRPCPSEPLAPCSTGASSWRSSNRAPAVFSR
jgi:5-dehydro-2-deoxygluconokinase